MMRRRRRVNVLGVLGVLCCVLFGLDSLAAENVPVTVSRPAAEKESPKGMPWSFSVPAHDGLPTVETVDENDPSLQRSRRSGRVAQEGMKILGQGDIEQARQLFWQALSLAPNNSLAYSFLAQIYFHEGNDDQGLRMLEQAGRYSTYGEMVYGFLEKVIPLWRAQEKETPPSRIYIAPFKDDKRAAICFTFDDGPKTVHSLLLPIFDRFGYTATVLINPANTPDAPEAVWGSWPEWRDDLTRGHEVGSHSLHHWDLTIVPADVREQEVAGSAKQIKSKLGVIPESFAFPFDRSDDASVQAVRRRFRAVRERNFLQGIQSQVFIPVYGGDKFSERVGRLLVDLAVVKKLWMVAECHAAKTEEIMTFKPITPEFLEKHLAYIQSLGDQVWVDTFGRQFAYIEAVKQAQLTVIKDGRRDMIFSLDSSSGEKGLPPLTVVINPLPEVPRKVEASAGKWNPAPAARVVGYLIYVDVVPGSGAVRVHWE